MGKKIGIACIWLGLWFGLDVFIHNDILFAGPMETLKALAGLAATAGFWRSIFSTLLRIAAGFMSGSVLGIVLAAFSVRFSWLYDFLNPFVSVLKSVPVASFVILILIWAGNRNLSYFICMAVVFPVIYLSCVSGLRAAEPGMLEAAKLFHMNLLSRIRFVWYPALRPHLWSAASLTLGMSWKSGVAAEVIGQPVMTIGNELYRAKIWLNTPALFAWTVVIVLLSKLFEMAVIRLLGRRGV